MSKNKKIPNWALSGHSKPKTRREFLAHGLIPFLGASLLKSPLSIIQSGTFFETSLADGLGCVNTSGSQWIPFIQIDLGGGAALMGNYVPTDEARELLPSYSIMGLGAAPTIERPFGNAPFSTQSGILGGIKTSANQGILDKTAMFGVCVSSRDDSSVNPMAMNGLVQRAGAIGDYLPVVGSNNSATVGRHAPAILPPDGPLVVNNFSALTSALSLTSSLQGLSQSQKEKLFKLSQKLNTSQSRKLASTSQISGLEKVVECAGIKNAEVVALGSALVDPRQSAAFNTIWNINANTNGNSQELIFGSLVYNTLKKQSGPATLVLGGYDYHGNARNVTDDRDRTAGLLIGRVLASADALNTPVFIAVTSDGAVGSTRSDSRDVNYTSDRGSAGVLYSFIYRPNSRQVLKDHQIGHFTGGQVAAQDTPVGSNPEKAAAAIVANYLALHGKMGELNRIAGREIFRSDELDKILVVG